MAQHLHELLPALEVVTAVANGPLQVFGLRRKEPSKLVYITLDDALGLRQFEVKEVSEAGSVPELALKNDTNMSVLLVAGEQLVGAKQNRVLNASLLVERNTEMLAPVSCVERGRWSYKSRAFTSKGSSSHGYLRRKMSKDAYDGYRAYGEPSSKQGEIWEEVDRKMMAMGSRSDSAALDQLYDDYGNKLDSLLGNVNVPDDCCGVVFALGGQIAGADIFDKPGTLAKLLPKLVRAYALDALEAQSEQRVEQDDVGHWIGAARDAEVECFDSPGLGSDYRLETDAIVGAALVLDDQVVHVELFPNDDGISRLRATRQQTPARPAGGQTLWSGMLVLPTSTLLFEQAQAAIRLLSESGMPLAHTLALGETLCEWQPRRRRPWSRREFRYTDLAAAATTLNTDALRLVITDHPLPRNVFSKWHAGCGVAIASACDWDRLCGLPMAAFIAYEIILHGTRLTAGFQPERVLHEETRGCLFDLCVDKPDIHAKLTAGRVCPECREALWRVGVEIPRLNEALLAISRMCV